ncbi:ExbD/TolR family protein [Alteromonas sp. CYL-A6]|uniref:ExbD/TolR family protein n=1 Tax=Alteromonas nitratireducens TaxID=3390813 RepID=UPI0034AEB4F1
MPVRRTRHKKPDAELDITSFLNLMIVLVPVLLMMMVFSRITVVELTLPGLAALGEGAEIENQQLEVVVTPQGSAVYFPAGYLIEQIPAVADATTGTVQQNWSALQQLLKQMKQTLLAKGIEKNDIVLMVDDRVDYQSVITLLTTTRAYPDVVAASVVDAALFPEVSFADIPADMATLSWPPVQAVQSEGGQ